MVVFFDVDLIAADLPNDPFMIRLVHLADTEFCSLGEGLGQESRFKCVRCCFHRVQS